MANKFTGVTGRQPGNRLLTAQAAANWQTVDIV